MCKSFSIVTGVLCGFWLAISCVHQVQAQSKGVKNVVLVHGAFADGSSWSKVIPLLESKGLKVIAVQNPLTSLKDDVAAAKRAIALMDGPVLLVGHSWGGVVVSEAGNDPKVAGLLYVAAFAPDNGQSLTDLAKTFPPAPGNDQVKPDASGFLSLTPKGIHEDFAQDLPETERRIILATQGTWWAKAPGEKISRAAWRTKPSWYIVSQRDRMINPELERKMAKTIRATTIELNASHVPMVSQPAKVATFIIEAARSVNSKEFVSK